MELKIASTYAVDSNGKVIAFIGYLFDGEDLVDVDVVRLNYEYAIEGKEDEATALLEEKVQELLQDQAFRIADSYVKAKFAGWSGFLRRYVPFLGRFGRKLVIKAVPGVNLISTGYDLYQLFDYYVVQPLDGAHYTSVNGKIHVRYLPDKILEESDIQDRLIEIEGITEVDNSATVPA